MRLHFSDPDNDEPGKRSFRVSLQGREVLSRFDIVEQAGGRNVPLVKEFKGIRVEDKIVVRFSSEDPGTPSASAAPLLNGFELHVEEPTASTDSDRALR